MSNITVKKPVVEINKTKIFRDMSRVITRINLPGNISRIPKILERVQRINEKEAALLLQNVNDNFSGRHKNVDDIFINNFNIISEYITLKNVISKTKKYLIGAYFTMEYSIESAALFNPSIVPHPDQTGVEAGNLRFILSLRATGEGHISSIVFRTGILNENGTFLLDNLSKFVETPKISNDKYYDSHLFQLKLKDMKTWSDRTARVFELLPLKFSLLELKASIESLHLNLKERAND